MSGTSLVLLAMYTTLNLLGPAGNRLDPDALPTVLMLLAGAALLTAAAIFVEGSRVKRPEVKRTPRTFKQARMKRTFAGPRPRRA